MIQKFKWFNLFAVLMVISVTLTLYFSYIILKHDYVGAATQIAGNEVIVTGVEPYTWSERNLEVGDKVISVDGSSPLTHSPVKNWGMLEQVNVLVVETPDGKVKSYTVKTNFDSQIVFHFIIPMIVIILCFYCSYLIHKSYQRSENSRESALLLMTFLFTFSLAYICAGASSRGDYFSRFIVTFLLLATPATYIHFMYSYYKELNAVWFSKKWLWFFYSLISLNLIFIYLRDLLSIDGALIKTIHLASFLIIFVLSGYLIVTGLKKISYKTQKYLIRVLIISNAFAFMPFLLLYVVPYVLFKVEIFSPVFLTGFLLIIPFVVVYQFLATKIYDIEFLIGRLRYFSLIITIPSVIGVILLITIKSGNPTVFSIRTFIMIFLLMFATLYFKEVLDYKFKLNRFSEKHNYQNRLTTYTQKIRIARNINDVSIILKQTIIDALLVDKAYLIEINKSDDTLTEEFINKKWIIDQHLQAMTIIKNELGRIIEISNGFLLNIGEAEGKTYIILALSDINTPILTRDERHWLNSLAYYTNVTLENFVKIENLMENLEQLENNPVWLNKIVFNLEEKQRTELAKDLHDSVLQDLISSKRHIETLYASYKDMDEDILDEEVNKLLVNMGSSIETTRKTCHELRPQILYDLGLDKALKKLVNQHQNNEYTITVTTSNLEKSIHEDVQLNIYRIAQELLNNARKHSCANNIRMVAVKIKEKVVLHYEDDGVGEDLDFIENKEGSMGLSGIKERVRILNGTINIETEPGKGFKVIVEV